MTAEDTRGFLTALKARLARGEIDEATYDRQREKLLADLTPAERAEFGITGAGTPAPLQTPWSPHAGTPTPAPVGPSGGSGKGLRTRFNQLADLRMEPGEMLADRWRIVRELGRGGFGVVFEAEDLRLEKTQAVKVLDPAMVARPDLLRRFRREVALTRELVHPRIVRVFEYVESEAEGLALFSMEYVKGSSVRSLLETARTRKEAIPVGLSLAILEQVLDALGAAHAAGVIHRDVTPANILLAGVTVEALLEPGESGETADPQVKLVDFGIAGAIERSELSQKSRVLGTVAYVAPEVLDPAAEVTPAADVYGAGAVFYELLTGEAPLGRFEDPSRIRAGIPTSLDELATALLARTPRTRPGVADARVQVAKALEQARKRMGPPAIRVIPAAPPPLKPPPPHEFEERERMRLAQAEAERQRQEGERVRQAEEARRREEAAKLKTQQARREQEEAARRREAAERQREGVEARTQARATPTRPSPIVGSALVTSRPTVGAGRTLVGIVVAAVLVVVVAVLSFGGFYVYQSVQEKERLQKVAAEEKARADGEARERQGAEQRARDEAAARERGRKEQQAQDAAAAEKRREEEEARQAEAMTQRKREAEQAAQKQQEEAQALQRRREAAAVPRVEPPAAKPAAATAAPRAAVPASDDVWTDPSTGLMWPKRDNGSDVNWGQADQFCRAYGGGGFHDWRLPKQDELERLYDKSRRDANYIKSPLTMTGWSAWSSEKQKGDVVYGFLFHGGVRSFSPPGGGPHDRALCVRRSGNDGVAAEATPKPANPAAEPKPAAAVPEDFWTDPTTGLMWAKRDNGSPITWAQAEQFCLAYGGGGFRDWRLPTIDELALLCDRTRPEPHGIRSPLTMTGRVAWSSEKRDASTAWGFIFDRGSRYNFGVGNTHDGARALCVRHSGG